MVQRGYRTGISVLPELFFSSFCRHFREVRWYCFFGTRVPSERSGFFYKVTSCL